MNKTVLLIFALMATFTALIVYITAGITRTPDHCLTAKIAITPCWVLWALYIATEEKDEN